MNTNDPRSKPNTERVIISLVAMAVGVIGTYFSLDVQAICQAVLNGG